MKLRTWLLATLSLAGALAFTAQPDAQEAEKPDPAEPELVEQRYEVRHLLAQPSPAWTTEPQPQLSMYGWHDHSDKDLQWPSWPLTQVSDQYFAEDTDELIDMFKSIAGYGHLESAAVEQYSNTRIVVKATPAVHTRISKLVELLTTHLRARIRIDVRRLDSLPQHLVLANPPEGKLIGSRQVYHGGQALFSDLRKTRITWSNEASWRGTVPTSADHYWGEEWGVGVLLLPDGRIRVQAWHARLTDDGMRPWETRNGLIQLPSGTWDMTPGAAVVPNGGALILDAPGGPFSISVSSEARLPDVAFDDGALTLLNPAGALPPGEFTSLWHLGPAPDPSRGEHPATILPLGNDAGSFSAIRYPEPVSTAAVEAMYDAIESLAFDAAVVDAFYFGPMLGLQRAELGKNDDPEEVAAARAALDKVLREKLIGPTHHQVEATILNVPRGIALAEGFADGTPTDAELAALRATAGVTVPFERKAVIPAGSDVDLMRLRLKNYLAGMHEWGWEDQETWFNTEIATFTDGVQVRVKVDSDRRISANAAWRFDGALKELKPDGAIEGETLEVPEWKSVQFSLDDAPAEGSPLSSIQPLEDGGVAVLILRSREVK